MPALADHARVDLRFGPSPIQRLGRPTAHLGGATVEVAEAGIAVQR